MSEPEFLFDIEQGSPEWFEVRRGIPTASEFDTILSDGKGHQSYLYDLAGEITFNQVRETYTGWQMQRGKEMEAEARGYYAQTHLAEVKQCGFVRRKLPSGRYVGCSPDGLIDTDKRILEIKTMLPRLQIELKKHGNGFPEKHKAQCQGALWITGWSSVDLNIYYRGQPWPHIYTAKRDEAYIQALAKHVEAFDHKLHVLVKQVGR